MAVRLGMPEIAQLMKRYLEEDSGRKFLSVEGKTLEAALADAAMQLASPLSRIEYEVISRGSPGVFTLGSKPWKIKAYVAAKRQEVELPQERSDYGGEHLEEIPVVKDADGDCFVRLASEGALLKVLAPIGRGRKPSEKIAHERLEARGIRDYDQAIVKEAVRQASGDYVKVAEYISNPSNDALVTIDITDQEMKAFAILTPAGPGGCDLSKEAILSFLRKSRVVFGVLDEALQTLEDKPVYREPFLVAEGAKAVNGKDASVTFNFETDKNKMRLKEASDGKVNFRELGLIQNVVAGQPLARKTAPEQGKPGRTVTGKVIPAKNGKDIPPPMGRNVHLAEDGATLIADINGQVTFIGGKINVEEILTVQGDVSMKTGNVMFLGTVIVLGNVEDGFSVKASGNIEIRGNVGKSEIVAEGDVLIQQGVNAKSGGIVQAGKSVWAKFIENATVEAGENIVVSDGMINTTAVANKKIICQGKRASIVGGRYRACEEINAKSLGSPVGGAETTLEVGYDPKSKEKMDQLQAQTGVLKKRMDEFDKNISTLNAQKKQKNALPEDKEAILQDYILRREEILSEIKTLGKEFETLQVYLNGLKSRGRISASGRIFPGVKICIKDVREDIKNEQKGVTFYLDNQLVRTTRYEEPEDEALKRGRPDVYKAD